MPELVNFTPFPNFRFYNTDNQSRRFGIIIVKGTFELGPDNSLVPSEEQAPMVFSDKCHGDVNVSSLWHPSDLVSNKPTTDVIVNGVARAPESKEAEAWRCGIRIARGEQTVKEKILKVTGPRYWMPKWTRELNENEEKEWHKYKDHFDGWELSNPDPIESLPLHYEYAYGGEIEIGQNDDGSPKLETSHHNPLGRGLIDADWTNPTKPVPAPQIECDNEPITDPFRRYDPQSLGPIPPAWLPRYPYGGTFDQNWLDNIWPAWPPDYDFKYNNSAHPDLIMDHYLNGDEKIVLAGLTPGKRVTEFYLPSEELFVDFVSPEPEVDKQQMNLDTVFLDIASEDKEDWRIYLSWRINFEPGKYELAAIHRREDVATNEQAEFQDERVA